MSTPKIYLRVKNPKTDGKVPVYIMVNMESKTLWFNTQISVLPASWIEESQRIKGTSQQVKDDNLTIIRCLSTINDIIVRYRLSGKHLSAEGLKNEYKNPFRRIDFYAFCVEALKERKNDISNQTYKNIKSSVQKMKDYKAVLTFAEITPEFLKGFSRHLRRTVGNKQNTVYSVMKNVKALLNIAISKDIVEKSPFENYTEKRIKTERIYLTQVEVKILWDLYKSKNLSYAKQCNLRHFLFMCMTGVRISDFRRLQKFSVHEDTLIFRAEKTKRSKETLIKVPLIDQSRQLIADENSKTDMLFNPISEVKLNKYIKEICKSKGINKPVTLHSARHTFATLFLKQTNDVASLQKLLGHSRITDTMIYVHLSDESVKEAMSIFNPLEEKTMAPRGAIENLKPN